MEFFGLKFAEGRVEPAPSKIEACEKIKEPQNDSEVRSLLGFAQYSAQFIPKYVEISAPLRKLTHKDQLVKWGPEEKKAFEAIRTALSGDPALGYNEVGKKTR